MGCLPTVWGQAVMGTKGADVCPCSAQAWLIEVSAWRLVAAVSHGGESRGGGPQSPDPSPVCSHGHGASQPVPRPRAGAGRSPGEPPPLPLNAHLFQTYEYAIVAHLLPGTVNFLHFCGETALITANC